MRGGGFDLLGRRSAPCSPTTGGIVLPAKLICLLPLLACAAACSEDGLTQAGSAMEPGDLAIREELPGEEVRGAGADDGIGSPEPAEIGWMVPPAPACGITCQTSKVSCTAFRGELE